MEEPRTGRFWNRGHDELHATPVGRAMWRHVRRTGAPESRNREAEPGPYETSYDVRRGYSEERNIVTP